VPTASSRQSSGPKILQADNLHKISWLAHGFSTRTGGSSQVYGEGSLNLAFNKHDSKSAVERNRAAFLKELGANNKGRLWPLVTLRQVHSDLIHLVVSPPTTTLVGDGLITATPNLLLAIQTADCLPIILVDPKRRAVGVFHAGWRGTLRRIIEKGVGEMRRQFGTLAGDLKAAIGPGIHDCCYEVGPEVRDKFASQFSYAGELFRETKGSDPIHEKYPLPFLSARSPGHGDPPSRFLLDLVEANRRQLLAAGVWAKNIEVLLLCTSCRVDLLFSFRAEKGVAGRMMGAVGIRP